MKWTYHLKQKRFAELILRLDENLNSSIYDFKSKMAMLNSADLVNLELHFFAIFRGQASEFKTNTI